jgi:glycosyltransferase involved in cell wall biosynthesis
MQSYGGISRYFTRLAESLSRANMVPHIHAPLHRNHYLSDMQSELKTGRYFKNFPPKTASAINLFNSYKLERFISKFKPNILHQTYYQSNRYLTADVPLVITVYDMIHERLASSFPPYDNTAKIKQAAIERADHIICISKSTQRDLIDIHNISEAKTSVVHLASDLRKYSSIHAVLPHLGQKPFLLFVGQRGGYKNFKNFISAVALSNNLKRDFNIVCFGGGDFTQLEKNLISLGGFDPDQVKHISGSDDTLSALYSSARAFVFPSKYEGFGLPILEAMSFGCPVLCSNTSSLPEVGGQAANYFDPNDLDEIVNVIKNCVYSDSKISTLRELGLENCDFFNWDLCAEKTKDIYTSCI